MIVWLMIIDFVMAVFFSLGWKLSHKISWLLKVTMHEEWWLKDGPFWSRTWGLLKFVRGSKSKEFCGVFDDGESTPPWTKSPRSGHNEDEKYPEFIATIKCQIDYLYTNLLTLPDFLPLMQNKNSIRFVHNLQKFYFRICLHPAGLVLLRQLCVDFCAKMLLSMVKLNPDLTWVFPHKDSFCVKNLEVSWARKK